LKEKIIPKYAIIKIPTTMEAAKKQKYKPKHYA
jgi:hypothetical protein